MFWILNADTHWQIHRRHLSWMVLLILTLRHFSIPDRLFIAAINLALLWGSLLSSNNGRLNTKLFMFPCCGCGSERQWDPAGRKCYSLACLQTWGRGCISKVWFHYAGYVRHQGYSFILTRVLRLGCTQKHTEKSVMARYIETFQNYILWGKLLYISLTDCIFRPFDFKCVVTIHQVARNKR